MINYDFKFFSIANSGFIIENNTVALTCKVWPRSRLFRTTWGLALETSGTFLGLITSRRRKRFPAL